MRRAKRAAVRAERELVYEGVFPRRRPQDDLAADPVLARSRRRARRDPAQGWRDRDHPQRSAVTAAAHLHAGHASAADREDAAPHEWAARAVPPAAGYATGYALDTIWAVSVDLVIVAMVFWVLSGLWMWWEMRVARGSARWRSLAAPGFSCCSW